MIEVRSLRKADEKQLLRLALDFFKKNQRGEIVSEKLLPLISYKNYDEHVREDVRGYMKTSPKSKIFVAEDKGRLIGYIHGRIINRPKMVLGRVGIVEDWFVEKKYRGKGISRVLWGKLEEWFKVKGCNRLELDAYTTNKHAIDIYHMMGFLDKTMSMTKKL